MNAERISIARDCLLAAHDGSRGFPSIVGALIAAGFEGYEVDYRRNCQTFYMPDGDSVTLDLPASEGTVAATFDAAGVEALVRWAQRNAPDYSYPAFCEKVKASGCAGYLVSFLGRRVLYFGRTAETHVEHFPS
jgi:uncharacterized protein YbcV (DUF1398 family)